MTSIDRTAYPRFACRRSEEELEERYDPSTAERRFVASNARKGRAVARLPGRRSQPFRTIPVSTRSDAGPIRNRSPAPRQSILQLNT